MGSFRSGTFPCDKLLGSVFAWIFSLGFLRLDSLVWALLLMSLRVLSLGIFRLGALSWDLSLGASRLGSEVGKIGLLRLGEPCGGSWGNLGLVGTMPLQERH